MINFGDNATFIANYERLKSSRKMGELYHCNKDSITAHARKIGYDYSKNKVIKITAPPEEVYQLYLDLGSTTEVAKIFNCSKEAVGQYLKKAGYTLENSNNKLMNKISNEEFIAAYDILASADKMAEKFNCSATAILNHAKKIGYDVNSNKHYKLTQQDKENIIKAYETTSSTELAKQYQVSRGMITKIWYDANLLGKEITINYDFVDLTGEQIGLWTVLYRTNKNSSNGSIIWHCRCQCGIEKDVDGAALRTRQSLSCGNHSNISKGNEKIKKILMEANIPFEIEKKFPSCKDKLCLPFDFYVNQKYLIEYDGSQHFDKNSIFNYEYTHQHDILKNQWCLENNIPLIRIPYTHYDLLTLNDLIPQTSPFLVNSADNKLDKIGEAHQIQGNTEVNNSIAQGELSPQSVEGE